MYVTNEGSNNVSVIDTNTNTVIDTIDIGNEWNIPLILHSILSIRECMLLIFLVEMLSVIDTTTNTVIDTIARGRFPIWYSI